MSRSASSQVQFVSNSFFPAELEFSELRTSRAETLIEDRERLQTVQDWELLLEAGFVKYARRDYTILPRGSLSIETITLKDSRASFSMVSLLRRSSLTQGPPGDFLSAEPDRVLFSQANIFVRIQASRSSDLLTRVANSVSNRIGRHDARPLLLTHFPGEGFEPSSVRYFLGPRSISAHAERIAGKVILVEDEVEIGQARYTWGNKRAVLSLIGFPTAQSADAYYENLSSSLPSNSAERVYFKRAGPILSVLAGDVNAETAEKILGGVRFTYSIQWIFDRTSAAAGLLGIRLGILGTVVQSLLFTLVLCAISLVTGVAFGVFRVFLRGYAPNNMFDRPDRTGVIRLKLNE